MACASSSELDCGPAAVAAGCCACAVLVASPDPSAEAAATVAPPSSVLRRVIMFGFRACAGEWHQSKKQRNRCREALPI